MMGIGEQDKEREFPTCMKIVQMLLTSSHCQKTYCFPGGGDRYQEHETCSPANTGRLKHNVHKSDMSTMLMQSSSLKKLQRPNGNIHLTRNDACNILCPKSQPRKLCIYFNYKVFQVTTDYNIMSNFISSPFYTSDCVIFSLFLYNCSYKCYFAEQCMV